MEFHVLYVKSLEGRKMTEKNQIIKEIQAGNQYTRNRTSSHKNQSGTDRKKSRTDRFRKL